VKSIRGFVTSASTRARGDAAERAAHRWLRRRGFEIIETNFRCREGEIDVIAVEHEVLCFIEIKARSSERFGSPLEAVAETKQRRIASAARAFLVARGWDGPCRFDVLGIQQRDGTWSFDLIRNAFWVGTGSRFSR
jgi:putative endonuclease